MLNCIPFNAGVTETRKRPHCPILTKKNAPDFGGVSNSIKQADQSAASSCFSFESSSPVS